MRDVNFGAKERAEVQDVLDSGVLTRYEFRWHAQWPLES